MRTIDSNEADQGSQSAISYHSKGNSEDPSLVTMVAHPNPTTALLLTNKPLIHKPEAGINPLVDAAGYLFSLMGKLRHIKHHKDLNKLHLELVREIENFRDTIENYPNKSEYLSEYLPISLYAICMTIDDIISTTSWGGQGKWDKYSLIVHFFNETPLSPENFLIILERLVLDPAIYIDVIEFFYICLSLGFRCHNASEFSHDQLEKITHSLYKRIRIHKGNFSKTLSPFPVRENKTTSTNSKQLPVGLILIVLSSLITAFVAGSYFSYSNVLTVEKASVENDNHQ